MLFSSPVFLFCYLPLTLLGFCLCPVRLRTPFLFACSLLFYAWGEGTYVFLLLVSIVINWLLALAIEALDQPHARRLLLAGAVTVNIGALVYFKYTNFLLTNAAALFGFTLPDVPPVHMPIGVSFVTFEALSYVIDVYRRHTAARRNPIDVGFYVSFFPHLIAGPILRFDDLINQLAAPRISLAALDSGVRRFIVGLAKKLLLANALGRVADEIFKAPTESLSAGSAWLGVVAYALQIYFDFSGYSDMAIGIGRMFGFELPRNFNLPYSANSIREFWHRWHISLSTWFRDYLFIPLGGSRCSPIRSYFNLTIVFLLCGFWHGASWNFVIWGLFHGAFLVLERLPFGRWLERRPRPLQHGYALLTVLVGWVFFRAETFGQASAFLRAMFGLSEVVENVTARPLDYVDREFLLALVLGVPLATLPLADWLAAARGRLPSSAASLGMAPIARSMFQLALLVICGAYLAAGTYNPFIYFRF